jgi:hypothetical protein
MLAPLFRVPRPLSLVSNLATGAIVVLGLALGGCTSRAAAVEAPHSALMDSGEMPAMAAIETVHRRKCGNCHTRVEPGTLPRATIEAAMARHRRRTKLTNDQWAELIEFLSRGGPAETRHTASLP